MADDILQTAGESFRRRLHYERASIGVAGSWNPDSSFANLRNNDFSEILNLRMQTIGGYEIRSGYEKYPAGNQGSLEILFKCEYRHKIEEVDVYFDITIYQVAGSIYIQGINRAPVAGGPWTTAFTVADLSGVGAITTGLPTIATYTNPPAIATCMQYGVNIVVTVYGVATYLIYPTTKTAATWVLKNLGKKLSLTPWQINYADKYNGDLFIVLYDDDQQNNGIRASHHWRAKKLLQGSTPDPRIPPYQYYRVELGAKYQRSNLSGFDNTEHKFYEWDSHDPQPNAGSVRSNNHLRKAGWGYRFIIKSSFTDARGNKIVYRNQASVDIWVNDTIYCPPQVYDAGQDGVGPFKARKMTQIPMKGQAYSNPLLALNQFVFDSANFMSTLGIKAVPSPTDLDELTNSFIKHYGQSWVIGAINSGDNGFDEALLLPTMSWLGYRTADDTNLIEFNFDSTYKEPYFTELPASLLASSPLCNFLWTDFSTTDGATPNGAFPSDAVEIEVFRTAWTDSETKLSNNDPSFQPHLYGKVGTIKKDGKFVDETKDEEIDFAITPELYDGYLEGQFSGQVIRELSGKIAIGNTSTSYYVFDPSGIFQYFVSIISGSSPTLLLADLFVSTSFPVPPDGKATDTYEIQYVDSDDNVSNLILLAPLNVGPGSYDTVAIPLPTGYDPSIVTVNVWYSHWNGASRVYKLIKNAAPTDNQVVVTVATINATAASTPSTAGNSTHPKIIKEGGELIWSNPNQPFDFPPINARIVRKTGNITAMETVVGELMIFGDTTIDYDNLNSFDPRGEEVSKWVGCIGRSAICKTDKIAFIMTANGLYFAEPGGVVSFPANVQSVVLDYISETITGVPPMANARRASIGYNGKRYELWVHFPSSVDLGGTLPEITIIYKFFNSDITRASVASFVNYRFDLLLAADFAIANPYQVGVSQTWNQPEFLSTSDGKLFCSYKESNGGNYRIATIDCDLLFSKTGAPIIWTNKTAIEHVYGMNSMNVQKMLREFQIAGDFDCGLTIWHGVPNPLTAPSPTTGWVNPLCPAHSFVLPVMYNASFPHRIGATAAGTMSVVEMYSSTPVMRLESTVSPSTGNHNVSYKDLDLQYWIVRDHPL